MLNWFARVFSASFQTVNFRRPPIAIIDPGPVRRPTFRAGMPDHDREAATATARPTRISEPTPACSRGKSRVVGIPDPVGSTGPAASASGPGGAAPGPDRAGPRSRSVAPAAARAGPAWWPVTRENYDSRAERAASEAGVRQAGHHPPFKRGSIRPHRRVGDSARCPFTEPGDGQPEDGLVVSRIPQASGFSPVRRPRRKQ